MQEIEQGTMTIDFDVYLPTIGKNLQRGFVWTDFQKSEFIKTIFKNHGISDATSRMQPICIVKNSTYESKGILSWQVIDGKQRLSTVLDFYQNKIPFFHENEPYFYEDLDRVMQGCINRFWFTTLYTVTTESLPITDTQKIEWFKSVNFLGTPQDKEHLENLLTPNNLQ